MARRTLSLRGRIVAAGVSVAATGGLIAAMASGGHTASASPTAGSSSSPSATSGTGDGSGATPYDGRSGSVGAGQATQLPQPQTRTGGS
jgi:hypothetical protein